MTGSGQSAASRELPAGLGVIERAFPGGRFPTGVMHEFVSAASEDAAATNGFVSALLSSFPGSGSCLWISTRRLLFPPALQAFGIAADRIIFLDLSREKEALWAIEEALQCDALSAVVGELSELGFTESRRLQLAVEQSRVTGFIHRYRPRNQNAIATASRWCIKPLSSGHADGLPGLGKPRWQVQLLKVRNGRPGAWPLEWTGSGFRQIPLLSPAIHGARVLKTG